MQVFPMTKIEINLGTLTNSCFVIMPFVATFQTEYEGVIKPAVEAAGLTPIRADEIYSKPHIVADIWKSLRSARVVVAELTGRNTNVFYEVGLAHALGKPVVIITRKEDDVPFDLKALRYAYYDTNDPFWGDNLKKRLTDMLKNLLMEKDYGTVFRDIKILGTVKYEEKKVPTGKVVEPLFDITGEWQGLLDPDCVVKLSVVQTGANLSGTMTVTYTEDQKLTIVNETMIGRISENIVSLHGISYSFLEQGAAKKYYLDSISAKISSKGNKMSGNFMDTAEEGGRFSFQRVTNGPKPGRKGKQ